MIRDPFFKRSVPFSLCLLLMLLFVLSPLSMRAVDDPRFGFIGLSVDNGTSYEIPIGKTLRLSIRIGNGINHPLRTDSFTCYQQYGEVFQADSISRLPDIIAPNTIFQSEQYYHAIFPGATEVQCLFKGTDTVTGERTSFTGTIHMPVVNGETRISVDAYASTQRVRVGETATVTVLYTNRSASTITNITVVCADYYDAFTVEGQQQNYTSLRPNESGFTQFRLKAQVAGGRSVSICRVKATESSTNAQITAPAPPVAISIAP